MQHTTDDRYLEPYNSKYGQYKFEKQFSFISKYLKQTDRVLDIAGGSGRFALPLFSRCQELTVIDISSDALQLILDQNPSIQVISGDFLTAKIQSSYSLIICIEALGHFQDYDKFFEKVSTLLKPNGLFLFTTVNPRSWRSYLRRFNKRRSIELNDRPTDEVIQLLRKHHFNVKDVCGFNWIPIPIFLSQSPLVKVFALLERIFSAHTWIAQSPWLLFAVQKNG